MFLPLLKVMKAMSTRRVKAIFTLANLFAQMPAISLIFFTCVTYLGHTPQTEMISLCSATQGSQGN
jgi:hypothetical protein